MRNLPKFPLFIAFLGYYIFYTGLLTIKLPNTTFNTVKLPKTNNKLIILLVDALRYDMAHLLQESIDEACLFFPMIVQPPTTTATKLKSLLSGYIPSIIEVKDSFSQQKITIQHLFSDFNDPINSSVVFVGDDTWDQLLNFSSSTPMDSFNVWDLDTVDTQVYKTFNEQLKNQPTVLIGHLLGVDHAGHTFYPFHSEMMRKFKEYTTFIKSILSKMDTTTTLLVMGDHGQDAKGDHGGDELLEVASGLLVYQKQPFYTHTNLQIPLSMAYHDKMLELLNSLTLFQNKSTNRIIHQVDLVPTISLLLGTSIPYSNLGSIIYELFPPLKDYSKLISNHIDYANEELGMKLAKNATVSQRDYDIVTRSILEEAITQLNSFKVLNMSIGILILLCVCITLKLDYNSLPYIPYMFIFASNSYTIYEQSISLFFIQLSIVHTFYKEFQSFSLLHYKQCIKPIVCMILIRLMNYFTVCRSELGPNCISTFYDGQTTNAPLVLVICSFLFIIMHYIKYNSLLLSILHWIYAVCDDQSLLTIYEKVALAWCILLIALSTSYISRTRHIFIHSLCILSTSLSGLPSIALGYFLTTFIKNPWFSLFFSYNLFFLLGHQATLSHIMWDKGFVATTQTNWTSPLFVFLNYFSSFILFPSHHPFKIMIVASSCICTFILKHHLMAWKIFFPRWMLSFGDLLDLASSLV